MADSKEGQVALTRKTHQPTGARETYGRAHIYFGRHKGLLTRLCKLENDHPGVTLSGLLVVAAYATIDDLERGLNGDKRTFMVNKQKVTL